jgi:ribonuclease HI
VAEWTEIQTLPASIEHETWIIYFDGSVMKEGAGVGLVFISPLGMRMECLVRLHFLASNNGAEYEALTTVSESLSNSGSSTLRSGETLSWLWIKS